MRTGDRFESNLARSVAVICAVFISFTYVAGQMRGVGVVFSRFLEVDITVGVMIVPQSLSYAKLAGLPVEYGLYSALMPVYAYVLFGSSRQLAVGPVALISLMLSTGLSHALESQGMTPDNTPNYKEIYARLAIQNSFLVGVTYIILGLLR